MRRSSRAASPRRLALGFSLAQPDRYKASADLLFQKDDLDRPSSVAPGQDDAARAPERVAATNLELASLQVVAAEVKRRLGGRSPFEQLQDRIQITPKGQADIVTVTARGPTPQAAVAVANAFADEVEAFRRRAAQEKVQRAINALRLTQRGRGRRSRRAADGSRPNAHRAADRHQGARNRATWT